MSLRMARTFVADGVTTVAATPHILPGVYHNEGVGIRAATDALQAALDENGIALKLVTGADVHVAPDLVAGIQNGRVLTLADTRYILIEPPHHVPPVRLEETFFNLIASGYVPILTHPERLSWVADQYDMIVRLKAGGVLMQITSGSLRGAFGRNAQSMAHRMLHDGMVDIVSTDAHDDERRPPDLSQGYKLAAQLLGTEEATHLVLTRPRAILADEAPNTLPKPTRIQTEEATNVHSRSRRSAVGRHGREGRRNSRGGGIFDRMRRIFGE